MNNLSGYKVAIRAELVKNLDWLYKHNPNKYSFIIALIKCFETGESVRLSRDLNKENPSVTVYVGDYMYKEVFEDDESACDFVDFVKSIKQIADK